MRNCIYHFLENVLELNQAMPFCHKCYDDAVVHMFIKYFNPVNFRLNLHCVHGLLIGIVR